MWSDTIFDASYRGVPFLCRVTDDRQGRAVSITEYPYQDGGRVDDLGRKPLDLSIQALVYGPRYEDELATLKIALDESGSGELIHPVYGPLPAKCTNYNIRHSADYPDSAEVDMQFVEDSLGEPGILPMPTAGSTADAALTSATGLAALLNAAERAKYMDKINRALTVLRSPERLVPGLLEAQRALQDVQSVTNELVSAYRMLTDPTNFTIVRSALDTYAMFVKLFGLSSASAPPYRQYVVSAPISARALAARLYGEPSRAGEIVQRNNIADPSFIAAGTSLIVKAF